MGVIPLTLDADRVRGTVVESQDHFDVEGRAVLIIGLERAQLLDQLSSNVTYDLRVGRLYRNHQDERPQSLNEGQSIELSPGATVIVQTEEALHLPRGLFGTIVPKVSLLQHGVSNTSSKVDPGFHGHLLITIFNLGREIVSLRRGAPLCALMLFTVDGYARLYDKAPPQLSSAEIAAGGAAPSTAPLSGSPLTQENEPDLRHHALLGPILASGVVVSLVLNAVTLFLLSLR
jgi:dCTP deaminase